MREMMADRIALCDAALRATLLARAATTDAPQKALPETVLNSV